MKKLLSFAFIIPLCLLAIVQSGAFTNDVTINWGLKPNEKGQTPIPPAGSANLLEKHNGIFVGDTSKQEYYLTFDLGYEAGHTPAVLDVLKKHNIKAIFFLCGHYLTEDSLVNRMLDEGHIIGNHTNKHKDLPTLSTDNIRADIVEFSEMYDQKYGHRGKPLKHFRPPKGRISTRVLEITNQLNLKTIMWSSAIVDWGKTPIDAKSSADKITKRMHPGAIVLLHIANSGMPKMLDLLIPQLQEKGYTAADATML